MLRKTILMLMGVAGVSFGILAILAAAGLADPRFAAVAFGIAMLAAGVDGIAGATVAGWPREPWAASSGSRAAPPGWMSSLGYGFVLVATGMVFITFDWVPRAVLLGPGAMFVVGLAFTLVGQYHDERRAEMARGGPDAAASPAADGGV